MSNDPTKTVRIQRPSRVAQDDRGRNVWVGRVDAVELELMSTMALERVLQSGNGEAQSEIHQLARSRKNGVLARDVATGHFRILSEADLKAFVSAAGAPDPGQKDKPKRRADVTADPVSTSTLKAADELSLVSTQILRKVVKAADRKDPSRGFDPYNKN